jgi:hypothetical protein
MNVHANDPFRYRGIDSFESVATSNAEDRNAFWPTKIESASKKIRKRLQLAHFIGAHVPFVVFK